MDFGDFLGNTLDEMDEDNSLGGEGGHDKELLMFGMSQNEVQ